MPHHEISPKTPSSALAESPVAPAETPAEPDEQNAGEQPGLLRRISVVASAACYFFLSGEQAAHAAPSRVAALAEAQGSAINISAATPVVVTLATLVTATVGVLAYRNQRRERRQERFIDALKDVAGTTDEAQLQARINILAHNAGDTLLKPNIFITAVQYLRARRAAIIQIREGLEGEEPDQRLRMLDEALAKRRNPDREMLKLLIQTRDAALERNRKQAARRGIGWMTGRGSQKGDSQGALRSLRTVTGLEPTRNMQLVDAAGINLDFMRDTASDCDLSRVDFTGAGLQGNNFNTVVFSDCDFGEAQLEGTTMNGCDLRGADFRAAYFTGDSAGPYFVGETRLENCIIDANTQFGLRPDSHPKARHHSNDPDNPQAYRGGGRIILRNLRSPVHANGRPVYSDDQIIAIVKTWQANGLVLSHKSDSKYLLRP